MLHIQHTPSAQSQKEDTVTYPVHSHRKKTRSHTRCTVTERRHGHTPGAQSQKEDTAMGGKRCSVRVPQEKATVNEFDQLPRSRLPSIAWSSVRQLPTCVRAQRQDEPSGHCGAGTQHLTWYTGTRIPHMTWYTGTRIHHLTSDSGTRIPHMTWYTGTRIHHLTSDSGTRIPHMTWYTGTRIHHLTSDSGTRIPHMTWYTGTRIHHLTSDSGTRIPHMTWYTGTKIHHLTSDSGTRIPHWTWDSGASVPHLTWESYQHTSRDVGQWYQNLIWRGTAVPEYLIWRGTVVPESHLMWDSGTRTPHLTWDSGTTISHLTRDSGIRIPHLTWDSGARIPHLTWDTGTRIPHLTWDSGTRIPGVSVPRSHRPALSRFRPEAAFPNLQLQLSFAGPWQQSSDPHIQALKSILFFHTRHLDPPPPPPPAHFADSTSRGGGELGSAGLPNVNWGRQRAAGKPHSCTCNPGLDRRKWRDSTFCHWLLSLADGVKSPLVYWVSPALRPATVHWVSLLSDWQMSTDWVSLSDWQLSTE